MSLIPKTVLGRTGLEVTRLGYGTTGQPQPKQHWDRLFNTILDAGLNFIDTANDYGVNWGGPAESNIGLSISTRRSEYYIATKCGCAAPGPHVWTRDNAFRGLHESLQRLRTDYIDVMQYHNPTIEECITGDLVLALQDMKQQGKVRWIGLSTTLPELPTFLEWDVFDVFQVPYSALEREHEKWITKAGEAGVGMIVRGAVAQGDPDNVSELDQNHENKWSLYAAAGLDELRENGDSRIAFMLRYILTHPYTHTNIVKTVSLEHFAENVGAISKGPLSPDIYAEVNRRLDLVGEIPQMVE